jgi:hypothetical protein
VVAAALLAVAGCASEDERTLADRLKEDSTLLAQLASHDPAEYNRGIARVKALGKTNGTGLILYLLQDPSIDNYRMEVVLARILADWRDPRAVGFLLQNLGSQDAGAAQIAKEGLLVFDDDPEVMVHVREMLGQEDVRARRVAADFLSRVETAEALAAAAARLRVETDAEVRALLLLGVLEGKGSRAKDGVLIDLLNDPDPAIRHLAWATLRRRPDVPEVSYAPDAALEERVKGVAQLRLWQKEREAGGDPER